MSATFKMGIEYRTMTTRGLFRPLFHDPFNGEWQAVALWDMSHDEVERMQSHGAQFRGTWRGLNRGPHTSVEVRRMVFFCDGIPFAIDLPRTLLVSPGDRLDLEADAVPEIKVICA